jgi:hypothetical protein
MNTAGEVSKLGFTFGQWLKKQTRRQDKVGDVARDFIAKNGEGKNCCSRFQSYETIHKHICSEHGASQSALKALEAAYAEYRSITSLK